MLYDTDTTHYQFDYATNTLVPIGTTLRPSGILTNPAQASPSTVMPKNETANTTWIANALPYARALLTICGRVYCIQRGVRFTLPQMAAAIFSHSGAFDPSVYSRLDDLNIEGIICAPPNAVFAVTVVEHRGKCPVETEGVLTPIVYG